MLAAGGGGGGIAPTARRPAGAADGALCGSFVLFAAFPADRCPSVMRRHTEVLQGCQHSTWFRLMLALALWRSCACRADPRRSVYEPSRLKLCTAPHVASMRVVEATTRGESTRRWLQKSRRCSRALTFPCRGVASCFSDSRGSPRASKNLVGMALRWAPAAAASGHQDDAQALHRRRTATEESARPSPY